jgi:hypothetical protein
LFTRISTRRGATLRAPRKQHQPAPATSCGNFFRTLVCWAGFVLFASGFTLANAKSPAVVSVAALAAVQSPDAAVTDASCAESRSLNPPGGHIQLDFETGDFAASPAQICAWVNRGAQAVSHYFGQFPVRDLRMVFRSADSSVVETGTTYGESRYGKPLIVIVLGRGATEAVLERDWVMAHELTHLAVPSLPERNHWLEEGIATYVEPIARVQIGQLTAERVWGDMIHGLPQGLPKAGDRGLDRTPTWGRTYWGGALFCLLADVEIRNRTHNQKSLRDALRGVLKAGGTIEHDWPIERVLAAGDAALGEPILTELYRKMATTPGTAELDTLWQQLGVSLDGRTVRFVDQAPLAPIRNGITASATGPAG